MKLLDRYIAKTVLGAIVLVTLMLTGLQVFILFVNQIGDIGKGDFGITQAAFDVLLQLPYQVYLFFPIASLLGSLIGLGVLANHSELIVMRAAGMSIGQITLAVLKAALLVIVLITAVGEMLVPYLSYFANDYKSAALSGGQTYRSGKGLWLRYGTDFISLGSVLSEKQIQDIFQFRFNTNHTLQLARHIDEARYTHQHWIAKGVSQTEFTNNHTKSERFTSLPWDVSIKPQILKISSSNPDEMSLRQLFDYLHLHQASEQNSHSYQLTFLQRLLQPFNTMVMMILAIPFIFGPLRSSSMGYKLLVGATVGFSFHIINRFVGPVSLVYQWPPVVAAFVPTLLFAALGLYLMKKMR